MSLAEIAIRQIPPGEPGIKVTLQRMASLAKKGARSEEIITLSRQITKNIKVGDKFNEAAAIYNWVKDNIRYVKDIVKAELIMSPSRLLAIGAGDCDDLSILLASLFESIGIPARFVAIKVVGKKGFSHVYPEAWIKDKWIPFDVASTKPKIGKVMKHWGKVLIQPISIVNPQPTLSEFANFSKTIIYGLGVIVLITFAIGVFYLFKKKKR